MKKRVVVVELRTYISPSTSTSFNLYIHTYVHTNLYNGIGTRFSPSWQKVYLCSWRQSERAKAVP